MPKSLPFLAAGAVALALTAGVLARVDADPPAPVDAAPAAVAPAAVAPAVAPAAVGPAAIAAVAPAGVAPVVTVYKSPSCGCCTKWVDHMTDSGFEVVVKDMDDVTPLKNEVGVPNALRSCHTAVVGGYTLEGHVPADLVQKLLKEKPKNTAGLAVPGMPMGSPGMEGPRKDAYEVVAYSADGKTRVYAER
jgi:hypothetical protein